MLFDILEVLARSTSIQDELELLKAGTYFHKVRNQGTVRGLKIYKRNYRLDVAELKLVYFPNKGGVRNLTQCTGGRPPSDGKLR